MEPMPVLYDFGGLRAAHIHQRTVRDVPPFSATRPRTTPHNQPKAQKPNARSHPSRQ